MRNRRLLSPVSGLGQASGFTVVELLISMTVLSMCFLSLASTFGMSTRLRVITRENAIATDAAMNRLEELRNTPFTEVFARYNSEPADDPDGPGTAPGHRFPVDGLHPIQSAADGCVGEVIFPTILDSSGAAPVLMLREDFVDRSLDMPRDLNGDFVIDAENHADDYWRLPVEIELRWRGKAGVRTSRVYAMLCELPKL